MKRGVFWLLTLIVLAGCAAIPGKFLLQKAGFSPHDGELVFSHEKHTQMTIECTACHAKALNSELTEDNLLPTEETCMQCHKPTQQCQLCHRNVTAAVALQPRHYPISFSHKKHEDTDCSVCHITMPASSQVSDIFYPKTAICRSCHEVQDNTCDTCHSGVTLTASVPLSHDSVWIERHETQAADADLMCEQCHQGNLRSQANPPVDHEDTSTCADCHRGELWPESVHDANYIQSHSVDAQTATTTCTSCHQYEECSRCHELQAFSFIDVHPVGWQFDHAEPARRQLVTCITCHVEDDCLGCHQTVSPHPSDWDEVHGGNKQVCKQCHVDEVICKQCHTGGIYD